MSVRVGLKRLVTLQGVAVGLNGGFVHIAQLGANCLNGTGRGDLDNASTTTRTPQDGNRKAQEGAAGEKFPASLSPVGFRLPLI